MENIFNSRLGIGYEYIVKNYSSKRQVEYYSDIVENNKLSEVETALIEYYFEKSYSILDVGTGCGRFAINAYEKGYTNITGIDLNSLFIERAKTLSLVKKYNIPFFTENIQFTSFKDKNFDGIIFTADGFSQIPGNPKKLNVLRELYRISKPGTYVILAVIEEDLVRRNMSPYAERLDKSRVDREWERKGFFDKNDLHIFNGGYIHFAPVKETIALVQLAGFKIVINETAEGILGHKDLRSSNTSRFFVLER